jgi:predicted short-subunit dehydrogenase-like oxidoreductase (DUF2520 family)
VKQRTDDVDERVDRGSASLAVVLTAPILVVLMFVGFQAAMWNHTRTEARVVARETAVLVARDGVSTGQAKQLAVTTLVNDSLLDGVTVTVTQHPQVVIVTISGNAPGLLRGTQRRLSVTATVNRETWVPL